MSVLWSDALTVLNMEGTAAGWIKMLILSFNHESTSPLCEQDGCSYVISNKSNIKLQYNVSEYI